MAGHWNNAARKRLFWADAVTPEVASAPSGKKSNRKSDPEAVGEVSFRLRQALAIRWPMRSVSSRIRRFAEEIGWSHTRAKDVYYADRRVSLRAFEQDEINAWFNQLQKEAV